MAANESWTSSSLVVRMRQSHRTTHRGGRRWLSKEQIAAKYGSEEVAKEITKHKESDEVLRASDTKPHPDRPGKLLYLCWDEEYVAEERDEVLEQLFEQRDDDNDRDHKKASRKVKKRKQSSSSNSRSSSSQSCASSSSSSKSSGKTRKTGKTAKKAKKDKKHKFDGKDGKDKGSKKEKKLSPDQMEARLKKRKEKETKEKEKKDKAAKEKVKRDLRNEAKKALRPHQIKLHTIMRLSILSYLVL